MLGKAVDGFSYNAFLVVKETQLQESVSLSLFIFLVVCYLEQIFEVLYSKMDVSIFGVGFGQLSMGFTRFLFIAGVLTRIQELVKVFNGFVKIAELFVNMSYFLVAFGLLVLIFSFP